MSDEVLHDILRSQGRMEGDVAAIGRQLDEISATLKGIDGRVRTVEQKAALVGGLGGVVAAVLVPWISEAVLKRLAG